MEPRLASAKLKLVDGCNLRCFMCDFWKQRREGELSTSEVFAVLADLAAMGCAKVHLTGGELFLRRDAVAIVAEATRLGMRVNLTTNGTVADAKTVDALLAIPIRSVTVSIDSPVPRVHDAIRGREGAWRRTVRTLDRLLRKRGGKTRVRVNTVVSRRNFAGLVEMPAFLRERPIDGWLPIPMDPWVPGDDAMRRDDILAYNTRVAPILAESVRVPGFDPWVFGRTEAELAEAAQQRHARGYYRDHLCHVPWFHTLVGPTGDVYPCCGTHRRVPPLGNVRDKPLREIYADAPYARLRAQMLVERMAACHACDDFLAENRALNAVAAGVAPVVPVAADVPPAGDPP